MIRRVSAVLLAGLMALGQTACSSSNDGGASGPVPDGVDRVLVFSKTAGFRHASIEAGILAVQSLGSTNDFEVEATEDAEQFTPENLSRFDAVIWLNTTLDVLNPPQQSAFADYIRAGGGFVGVHSAADTEHDWPFYGQLVGAYFLAHPVLNQPGSLIVEDNQHPSMQHLGSTWSLPVEEFYSFKSNPRGAVRVLQRIDESSYQQTPNTSCDPSGPTFPQGFSGQMGDHPMSWCHQNLGGRAWYTALGHEAYLYQEPDFLAHLLGGILTVIGRLPMNCSVDDPAGLPSYEPPVLEACENQLLP